VVKGAGARCGWRVRRSAIGRARTYRAARAPSQTNHLPAARAGLDVYNINETCAVPPLCTDMSGITTYLNTPSVKSSLGVPASVTWAPCNDEVRGASRAPCGAWQQPQAQERAPRVLTRPLFLTIPSPPSARAGQLALRR
jgi:hypothetical protein